MEYKNDKIKDNISQTSQILQINDVLQSCNRHFKAIVVYSPAGDFVMGLCGTLLVPIVHAALSF